MLKNLIEMILPSGKKLFMNYSKKDFDARIDTIEQADPRLKSNWGDKLYRIILVSKSKNLMGSSLISVVQ